MKVKVLIAFADNKQSYYKGDTVEVTEEYAKMLVEKGFIKDFKDSKIKEEIREIKVDKPKETKKKNKK